MQNNYELESDHLAISLTRPPTKLGVPLVPFFMSILGCVFGWMVYQALSGSTGIASMVVFIALWLALYAAMVYATFNDPFGLNIAWINFQFFRKHTTHAFWGHTDSYAP
jgi:type IV secretory pathway VirB3-like protein